MAKKYAYTHMIRKRKKRKGIHSKSKTSGNKNSTNYKKVYIGQGR